MDRESSKTTHGLEQVSVHGQEEENSTPPFIVLELKKLTQQDLKKAGVRRKLIKEKPVCKYCNEEFKFPSFMLRHVEQVHEKKNSHSCTNCS
jgi:hypothetical protein